MRILLRDLGVPDSAMVEEPNSRTTQQNARYSGLLLRERNIKELLLVTSAWHMRRAKKLFEREGFQVYPVPTDYHEYPKSGWLAFLPNADALEDSGRSIKEWVGSQVQ